VPSGGVSHWRSRIENLDEGDSTLSIREGFVPDFQGGGEVGGIPNDDRSRFGGGTLAQQLDDESFTLFPAEGESQIPGGIQLYMVATSEGTTTSTANSVLTLGTTTSFTIHSDGELATTNLDLSSNLHSEENTEIDAGEIILYDFTVPANASSLEIELTEKENSLTEIILRRGDLFGGTPFSGSHTRNYGFAEGTNADSLQDDNILTIIDPEPGLYTLGVRSTALNRFEVLGTTAFNLRVEVLAPRSLSFCGGSIRQNDQPANSFRFFEVIVPDNPNYLAWDLEIESDYEGGEPSLFIRRSELPIRNPSPSSRTSISGDEWPEGFQFFSILFADWINDALEPNGNRLLNTREVFPFGSPLEPGTYFIGVYNNEDESTSYTLRSRCVAPAGSVPSIDHPVQTLAFSGAGSSAEISKFSCSEQATNALLFSPIAKRSFLNQEPIILLLSD